MPKEYIWASDQAKNPGAVIGEREISNTKARKKKRRGVRALNRTNARRGQDTGFGKKRMSPKIKGQKTPAAKTAKVYNRLGGHLKTTPASKAAIEVRFKYDQHGNKQSTMDNKAPANKNPKKPIASSRSLVVQKKKKLKGSKIRKVAGKVGKAALRGAGPVGVAVSIFDFLKGKPAY